MPVHESTFRYLKPSSSQLAQMDEIRAAGAAHADVLARVLPDGEDKLHVIRKLRDVAMWANVALTRNADGSPRDAGTVNTPAQSPDPDTTEYPSMQPPEESFDDRPFDLGPPDSGTPSDPGLGGDAAGHATHDRFAAADTADDTAPSPG